MTGLALPPAIAAYVAANPDFDVDGMLAPFAPDAVVLDEGGRHVGPAAIRAWIEQATVANAAVMTPVAYRMDGEVHVVDGSVAGAFPGSPVNLTFRFRLRGGAIAELAIS